LITVEDFISLPYTPDLTQAGISYACRSLPHTYGRMGGLPFDRLRRIVVGISVELAFRRYLAQQNIPFDVKGTTPFTDPDRYDVSLGGHRCDLKSFLISHRDQITSMRSDPAQMLQAPGLVPVDQSSGDDSSLGDIYLFAFLTGLIAASSEDVGKASSAGQPIYLLHAMPANWVRPEAWIALGPLALKSESPEPIMVEIGGQDAAREFIACGVEVPPFQRMQIEGDFHSLAYVHVNSIPGARLGIHSPARRETHLILPAEWGNIWIYGMRIYLTGWITRDEFRQRAGVVQEGSRVFQYDRTRTKNLAIPISDLHPLPELMSRVRAWTETRNNISG
jgi:hypothetical protein